MVSGKMSILKFIKVRMVIITFLILGVVASLGRLAFNAIEADYTSRQLINVLGKQRMYSQMMAKDASMLYVLYDRLNNDTEGSENEIKEKILQTKAELQESERQFDTTFKSIKSGKINIGSKILDFEKNLNELEPALKETDATWNKLRSYIDEIISSEGGFDVQYIDYINENNHKLLDSSDKITGIVVMAAKKNMIYSILLTASLGTLAVISTIILLFNINRYLILPLSELYRGVSEIGLAGFRPDIIKPTRKELVPVIKEVNDVFSKFNSMIELIENLNYSKSFTEILQYIYSTFSSFIPYNHIGIALIGDDEKTIRAAYAISDRSISDKTQSFVGYKVSISNTSLERIIETGRTRIINDFEEYTRGKQLKDYNKKLLEIGIRSSITLPLKINNRPVGVIFFSSLNKNVYTSKHEKFLKILANSIAISFEKNIFTDELLYSSILALAKLAESRDIDTGEHLNRMKTYSRMIAEFLYEDSIYRDKINLDYINDIERFSPLHDIGKVAIRDEILLKPDKLTDEEFEIMKTHTLYGGQVLRAAEENIEKSGRSVFKLGIEIAEGHHEKWDGTGYPYGRKGEEIPLSARIVALADVFDALTSKRPYKKPFSFEESIRMIEEKSGFHFDPEIVRVFLKNGEKIKETYNSFHQNVTS
ncbi:HD domain-containing phosphohydrolase [Fonticella tunisiensis]|uniref:HD domain-containing phosphohydrolase n=1 Tax=Fonticella tunisiensis TaxID=1096341 RepID=UPI00141520F7|nr:HD domain-containing phosphohydrolase [Fonticella tunisiensis]